MAKTRSLPTDDGLTTALEALLTRIDTAACAHLAGMRWPSDPVAIYAILNGEQAAPRSRTRTRDKQRAKYAMHTRLYVANLRRVIRRIDPLTDDEVTAAVMAALHLGGLASEVVVQAARKRQSTVAGIERGKQKTAEADPYVDVVEKYRQQWLMSDDLQEIHGYRSPVPYIKTKTKLPSRTVQNILKRTRQ